MKTRSSSKGKRPPDEDVTSKFVCLRVVPADEIVPESDSEPKQESPSRTWVPVKQRLRDALGQLRALLFIHVEDERVCLRLRGFLQFHQWSISWLAPLQLALLQSKVPLKSSLPVLLQDLNECLPDSNTEELKQPGTILVLSVLLAQVLHEDVTEYRPLLEKLPKESRLAMEVKFGEEYTKELSSGGSLQDLPNFQS